MSRFFALAARTEHQGNKKPASDEPAGFCYAFKKEKIFIWRCDCFFKRKSACVIQLLQAALKINRICFDVGSFGIAA